MAMTRQRREAPQTRPIQMRYGTSVPFVGLASFLVFSAFLILMAVFPNKTVTAFPIILFTGFAALGLVMVVIYATSRLEVSDDGLYGSTLFSRPRRVSWRDIRRIDYRPGMGWFLITTASDRPLYVSVMRRGIDAFARLALARCPHPTFSAETLDCLRQFATSDTPSEAAADR